MTISARVAFSTLVTKQGSNIQQCDNQLRLSFYSPLQYARKNGHLDRKGWSSVSEETGEWQIVQETEEEKKRIPELLANNRWERNKRSPADLVLTGL